MRRSNTTPASPAGTAARPRQMTKAESKAMRLHDSQYQHLPGAILTNERNYKPPKDPLCMGTSSGKAKTLSTISMEKEPSWFSEREACSRTSSWYRANPVNIDDRVGGRGQKLCGASSSASSTSRACFRAAPQTHLSQLPQHGDNSSCTTPAIMNLQLNYKGTSSSRKNTSYVGGPHQNELQHPYLQANGQGIILGRRSTTTGAHSNSRFEEQPSTYKYNQEQLLLPGSTTTSHRLQNLSPQRSLTG
ncbi:unnamed protein product, partial [Amoebophrya sp. A120]|eukprot:GSA120T00003437001.1